MTSKHTVLALGLGKTGQSFLKFDPEVIAVDSQAIDDVSQAMLQDIDEVWVSPGIPPYVNIIKEIQKRQIPIKSDIQVFVDHLQSPDCALHKAKTIMITGTNGKSTVTTLVTEMLKAAGINAMIGGNIGIPVLDLLTQPMPDVYVFELSSFQLHYTDSLHADVAVLLNLAPDHENWHGSFEAYCHAKRKIFQGAKQILDFSNTTAEIQLTSDKVQNWPAKVACQIVNAFGVDPQTKQVQQTLATFKELPHRCEWVPTQDGVEWIDDSKATNVHAAVYAIDQFFNQGKDIILLAGGVGKGQDFNEFAEVIAHKVKHVMIYGEVTEDMLACFKKACISQFTVANNMKQAIWFAKQVAEHGDVVLLSPACASFDEFNNFEERGAVFKQCATEPSSQP